MPAKKKVLLLNPPGDQLYARDKYCTSVSKAVYYWPQVDLISLSGILKNNFDLLVIDSIVEKFDEEKCQKLIGNYKPDIIIFLTSSASWSADFEFIFKVRDILSNVRLIANGGMLLFKGKLYMEKFPFLDAIILDYTQPDIDKYLMGERSGLNNLIYRDKGSIMETSRSKNRRFSVPIPRHELFPLKKYVFPLAKMPVYSATVASIGCPYGCSFCIPATLTYRVRDVENLIDELKFIKFLNIHEILLQDSTFGANREQGMEICKRMIEEKLNLKWICQSRIDTVDEELLTLMKEAGCHSIQFGIESGDDEILKSMSKGITREQSIMMFKLMRKIGIRTNGFFIIGMPGDTVETIKKTIDFALELDCDVASFSLPMPHPGTRLGEAVRQDGHVLTEKDLFDDIKGSSIKISDIPFDEIWALRNLAYKKFYLRPFYILRKILQITTYHEFKTHILSFLDIFRKILKKKYQQS
ncbi:radical SAM protein [bacterium]|nr:radical SAM protein [bacterium]